MIQSSKNNYYSNCLIWSLLGKCLVEWRPKRPAFSPGCPTGIPANEKNSRKFWWKVLTHRRRHRLWNRRSMIFCRISIKWRFKPRRDPPFLSVSSRFSRGKKDRNNICSYMAGWLVSGVVEQWLPIFFYWYLVWFNRVGF